MIRAIKSIKVVPQASILLFSTPKHCSVKSAPSSISTTRFRRVTTLAAENPDSMAQHQQQKPSGQDSNRDIDIEETTGPDLMTHSFGEGYATRSDEEGFGGIYGANQATLDKEIDENHPAYDKNQGCEVKEKEKARNQKSAAS